MVRYVFYQQRPRHDSLDQAEIVIRAVQAYVQAVGLFVNSHADEIQDILKTVPLDILQFHGDETPEQCQAIAQQVGRRWYKAIQVKPDLDVVAEIQGYQD